MTTVIINERNSFTVKDVQFLIVKTELEDGLWYHSVRNLTTNERRDKIPDHKIRRYL